MSNFTPTNWDKVFNQPRNPGPALFMGPWKHKERKQQEYVSKRRLRVRACTPPRLTSKGA